MSRMILASLLALALLGVCADPAHAVWWTSSWYSPSYYYPTYYYSHYPAYYYSYYPTYYYVAPAPIYYSVLPPLSLCPVPAVRAPSSSSVTAQPAPAPPSQSKEPPLAKKTDRPPQVTESRSFSMGDGKSIPAFVDASGKEVCKVGFWNVSGKDVTLTVEGKAYSLPKNRNTTLTVSRTFSWQIDGREAQPERIADDKITHEIVIR